MHGIPTAGRNPFFVFFGWFLFWLFVLFFGSFLVCVVFDGIAHWTLYWSTTSSFEAADPIDGLASNCNSACLLRLNVCNDLAKDMKALDGKKDARALKARRIVHPANSRSADEWVIALCNSRANFLATTAVPEDPAEAIRGGLVLTPLLGCKARTPLDWTHAWTMLGEWAGIIAFPIPEQGEWPRHGDGRYLRPDFVQRTPPFLTWARPIFEQGALSPMSVFPANFPILCLPGDKLFQSKELDNGYSLPPVVHAFHGSKVGLGQKLQQWQSKGLQPLAVSLIGVDEAPPLWTHPTGCDFVRGSKLVAKPHVGRQRSLTKTQVLLLQSLWTPVEVPNNCPLPRSSLFLRHCKND